MDLNGHTPLHLAAENVHGNSLTVCIPALIKSGIMVDSLDRQNRTALHLAVLKRKFKCIDTLIKVGANVKRIDIDGHTPLHYAYCN